MLVDGFFVSEILREKYPEYFYILTTQHIAHQYLEGLNSVDSSKEKYFAKAVINPVISLFGNKIEQIR